MSWLDNLLGLGGYRTIQGNGVAVTQRETLNFAGVGVTVADNAAQARTDATISANLVWAAITSQGFYWIPTIVNPVFGVTPIPGVDEEDTTGTSVIYTAQSIDGGVLEGSAGGTAILLGGYGGSEGGDAQVVGGFAELANRKAGDVLIETGWFALYDGTPVTPTTDSTGGSVRVNIRTTGVTNPGAFRVRFDGSDRLVVDSDSISLDASGDITLETTDGATVEVSGETVTITAPDTMHAFGSSEASLRSNTIVFLGIIGGPSAAFNSTGLNTVGRTYGADHTLADSNATINVSTGSNWALATPTANRTTRLGATGATGNDGIRMVFTRTDTAAFTWEFVDDGTSETLYTFPSATPGKIICLWDDVNGRWRFDSQELTP